jgi:hypothetical protein
LLASYNAREFSNDQPGKASESTPKIPTIDSAELFVSPRIRRSLAIVAGPQQPIQSSRRQPIYLFIYAEGS